MCFDLLIGSIIGAGLVVAGSDGPWFPWLNLASVIAFGLAALAGVKLRPVPWRK